jgi:multiple sugar transport system permease protein
MHRNQKHNRWGKFILLAPALLLIFVTTIYPMASSFWLSFQDWRLTKSDQPNGFVGLQHYQRALTDENFINSVVVTTEFTLLSVGLTIVIGLGMALVLQKKSVTNAILKTLLIFPFAVSPALKGYSFRFMLAQEYGIIQAIIGFLIPPLTGMVWLADPFWSLFWIAITEVWGWAPLYALMFIGALGSIPTDIFEAAKVDGATNAQVFWNITLPMLAPVLLIATLLKTIFSLKIFDQVVTMTGGGPGRATQSLNHFVYQVGFRSLDMGYSAALAYILLAGLAVVAFLYVKSLYRQGA